MPVTADSYESKVSEAAVALLAACAAFRTLTGTATTAAAKGRVLEDWAGRDDAPGGVDFRASDGSALSINATFAAVRVTDTQSEQRAHGTWGRRGTVLVVIFMKGTATDTPAEAFRRARNAQGAIRAEMEAQIGGAATFAWAEIRTEQIVQDDDTGCFRGFYQIPLTIEWRDCP